MASDATIILLSDVEYKAYAAMHSSEGQGAVYPGFWLLRILNYSIIIYFIHSVLLNLIHWIHSLRCRHSQEYSFAKPLQMNKFDHRAEERVQERERKNEKENLPNTQKASYTHAC